MKQAQAVDDDFSGWLIPSPVLSSSSWLMRFRVQTQLSNKNGKTQRHMKSRCHGDILTCQKAYSHMMLNHPYRYQQNLARELSENLAISYPRDVLFHGNRIIRRHVRRQHQDQGDWKQTHQGLRDDAMGQVFKVSPNDAPHLGQDDTPILSTISSLARVWSEMVSSPFWKELFFASPLDKCGRKLHLGGAV